MVKFQVHTSPTPKGRLRMASPGFQKSKRSWQEIAAEAMRETDPDKRAQLANELDRALEERDKAVRERNQSWRDRHPSGPS